MSLSKRIKKRMGHVSTGKKKIIVATKVRKYRNQLIQAGRYRKSEIQEKVDEYERGLMIQYKLAYEVEESLREEPTRFYQKRRDHIRNYSTPMSIATALAIGVDNTPNPNETLFFCPDCEGTYKKEDLIDGRCPTCVKAEEYKTNVQAEN